MKVVNLTPDTSMPDTVATTSPAPQSELFAKALDALGGVLGAANDAEDAFASGHGSLVDAMYERARADVVLSVATATAQRTVQAVQSITGMQI